MAAKNGDFKTILAVVLFCLGVCIIGALAILAANSFFSHVQVDPQGLVHGRFMGGFHDHRIT